MRVDNFTTTQMYFLPPWPQDKWEWILWIGFGLLLVGLLVLSYRRQKKEEQEGIRKFPGLCKTLQSFGVQATLRDTDAARDLMEPGDFDIVAGTWQFIEINQANIDFVYFLYESIGEYATKQCYLHWIVKARDRGGARDIKDTVLVETWSSRLRWGKWVGVEWEGDDFLAARLNADHALRAKLLPTAANDVMATIKLSIDPEGNYYDIRTVLLNRRPRPSKL